MAKSDNDTTTGSSTSKQDVQTAESQTKVNAAPTLESSATDPRPVDTVNGGLVFNNGASAERPADEDTTGEFTLTGPNGPVTVTSSARRDALVARGYTSS